MAFAEDDHDREVEAISADGSMHTSRHGGKSRRSRPVTPRGPAVVRSPGPDTLRGRSLPLIQGLFHRPDVGRQGANARMSEREFPRVHLLDGLG